MTHDPGIPTAADEEHWPWTASVRQCDDQRPEERWA
jgi:hypothetical protein